SGPRAAPSRTTVEGTAAAAALGGHGPDVPLDRPFVQGVEHSHLGRPARCHDVLRHRLELLSSPSGDTDPRTLAGKGPSYAASDPTAAAVDDRHFALQKPGHINLLGLSAPNFGG